MTDLHQKVLHAITIRDTSIVPYHEVNAALRTVVELHAPFQRSTLSVACRTCSTPVHTQPGRYVTVVNHPCATIQAIARELGIEATS